MKHRGSIVGHSRILGLAISSALAVATLAGCASGPDSSIAEIPTVTESVDSSQASIATDPPVISGRVVAGGLVTEDLGIAPAGQVLENVRVERVVDGDTFKAVVDGELVSVRIIGIDTPETVKPGAPIDCYGPESSEFATAVLNGVDVTLEFDDTQGRFDRYDRVLAHVWLPTANGGQVLYGAEVVAQGYGYENQYGNTPTTWTPVLRELEGFAKSNDEGLWAAC
jgi:micrococcal nuclease